MKRLIVLSLLMSIIACSKQSKTLEATNYRIVLNVQDNRELPFIMKFFDDHTAEIYNADEIIKVDEIEYRNDSVFIRPPVFEGYIAAEITESGFEGVYVVESKDRSVKTTATKDSIRFLSKETPKENLEGIWEVTFSPNGPKPTYISKGIFQQSGNHITGTFRTLTGDYRYLEGVINGNEFQLSTFDGSHAFLFIGTIENDEMKGIFYSGNHWREPFTGFRNPDFELQKADELTYLKEDYETLDFSFPNEKGEFISLSDNEYQNRVTIIQIMGSWCPNCLDESKYLTHFSKQNPEVKIVSLAFEIAKTKGLAFQRINRLREKIGIPYPILLAQYGSSSKLKANEKLPMLNHVLAYPTTIILDKKGTVRKIHTGFNGPATGQKYIEFVKEFESFLDQLSRE